MTEIKINLRAADFGAAETVLAETSNLVASIFRYASGVAAMRIRNGVGEIVVLPFHGQQIWDATFFGRRLTMRSMFDEPVNTTSYLHNYGAFFLHCGATAMGNVGPGDTHALHGEMPNAPYAAASLLIGEDEQGAYMGLTGTMRYTQAFAHNYEAKPRLKIHAGSGRLSLGLGVRNLKHTPMELMYLAHINFRPVDGAKIVDTVAPRQDAIRIRTKIPDFFTPTESHKQLLAALEKDPGLHRDIVKGRAIDPELVMGLDFEADRDGWAHALQLLPDGGADFVSFRPSELKRGVRWLTRTANQDALGLYLPATAEADGYTAEKAKGNIVVVPAGGEWHCALRFGALQAGEAEALRKHAAAVR